MRKQKKNKQRKPYQKPTATKLSPEEAKFKLLDHASKGDEGAKDLLKMMFPEQAKLISENKKRSARRRLECRLYHHLSSGRGRVGQEHQELISAIAHYRV
jgi:hypothetical protein